MTFLSPTEQKLRRRRRLRIAGFLLFGLVLCLMLDNAMFHAFAPLLPADPQNPDAIRVDKLRYEILDWYRMLRVVGFAPTWFALAAAVLLVDLRAQPAGPGREPFRRAAAITAAVVVAGIAAELIKLIAGKERPIDGDLFTGGGLRVFLGGFADPSNLGFPSSHTAVAFAGAAAVAILWRPAAPVLFLLAAGCGLTRMLAGAHWFSDVYGGAVVGIITAQLVAIPIAAATADRSPAKLGRIG